MEEGSGLLPSAFTPTPTDWENENETVNKVMPQDKITDLLDRFFIKKR
jgi:hypothetical protein